MPAMSKSAIIVFLTFLATGSMLPSSNAQYVPSLSLRGAEHLPIVSNVLPRCQTSVAGWACSFAAPQIPRHFGVFCLLLVD